jgi:hypothetical protein
MIYKSTNQSPRDSAKKDLKRIRSPRKKDRCLKETAKEERKIIVRENH